MASRAASIIGAIAIAGAPSGEAVQLNGGGFLSQSSKMQPDVVASDLVKVDSAWTSMAMNFAACNATMSETGADCSEPSQRFEKSCATIVSAVVQASSGERGVVKEYMDDVCSQSSLTGYPKEHCQTLAQSMVDAMTADNYDNRENLNAIALCGNYWSHFTASEQARAAREQAEREAAEKKAEEERLEADKQAEEEAQRKAAEEAAAQEATARAAEEAEEAAAKAQAEQAEANATQASAALDTASANATQSNSTQSNSTVNDVNATDSATLNSTQSEGVVTAAAVEANGTEASAAAIASNVTVSVNASANTSSADVNATLSATSNATSNSTEANVSSSSQK